MSRESFIEEQEFLDAVNDEHFSRPRASRGDTLRVRRQVEALLEERRLKRAIEDDWLVDDEEEEEE
ncbi:MULTISPECIES: hypothetical protein [Modicisalibacter]|uniref:PA3496 family putative envelope integrity protein n=1 Tax=Modicisalibacter TaxID=574347 RepID=UPI00100B21C9|nr:MULTISPECIES: hypothetical protein [Halomonadaceae]MBZ9557647.1 hypothetical protein [Modicisalibacter sp. R2A 31.J]MBZ9573689.1 hypothetical protein [Modicisalibacter sp. MOD 31.J]